ncbi:hypothetical protein N7714_04390 [Pseudomonas aeruginosa]|uniref:hypothetical protein n=1 Tax=Pseudomonas aeruginosa TaxID=287 RepID=UPI001F4B3AFE|nr:hypothetical protein [Pseudomonas aeruginosa]MDG9800987.1 hypothetical protein [Pseudomonas aeruginosa]MDG9906107.1 hypothetical protein [Pseudomonas aeruginosa]MDH0001676.1 hypothetical protein [Pseudomonas aeruginosa]MDH0009280.1 hypothetical protein [Pseudomonas aeruginosa]MDH0594939.1 hypothetical protein [Pseudomonas aeruginosa]
MNYKSNDDFAIDVGFSVDANDIKQAVEQTNTILSDLPSNLFKSIDYKTTSAMIGAIFCNTVANLTDGIVNPIEKGHPDIIPASAADASEEALRNYQEGLEIKCTVGNITTGANLRAGETRIDNLTGITWQAHHREVEELLGIVWDFVDNGQNFNHPAITGAFYSSELSEDDWGAISGTTGRNTKVTGMSSSGKAKMGNGWVTLIDDPQYITKYERLLKFKAD